MLNNIDLAERFISIAEKFIYIVKTKKATLDFTQAHVVNTQCGTVACHGGWALVALAPEQVAGNWRDPDYAIGKDKLAKYLGFESSRQLEKWAILNSKIWGSSEGHEMFGQSGYKAFNNTPEMTLTDIAKWYLEVAERLLHVKN